MTAPELGRSYRPGLGVNLLVKDVAKAVKFAEDVLWATVVYWDEDFAAVRACGSEWMLHADHTYDGNPLSGIVKGCGGAGARASSSGSMDSIPTRRKRGHGRAATRCWRAPWTSRTDCANASSSTTTDTCGYRAPALPDIVATP